MNLQLPEKLYYKISEVAEAFSVNTSLIRFWEKEFDILKPKKNKKGTRYFTQEDIKHLKIIYHLVKERGYTLDGAKEALRENARLGEELEIIFRLEKIRATLVAFKSYFDEPYK